MAARKTKAKKPKNPWSNYMADSLLGQKPKVFVEKTYKIYYRVTHGNVLLGDYYQKVSASSEKIAKAIVREMVSVLKPYPTAKISIRTSTKPFVK